MIFFKQFIKMNLKIEALENNICSESNKERGACIS